jgi:glycine/D-amino acid oxidase-like deaminating enzyme
MTFPFSLTSPPEFSGRPPEAADLVVVGGGVAGICTALFAARRGLRVAVCEKGRVAAEQSSRNWGWIRQQGRDLRELPITMEALRHWHDFAALLGDGLGLRTCGTLYVERTEAHGTDHARWLEQARAHGVDTRQLSRRDLADHLPDPPAQWRGALLTPSDARAEPWVAVPMLARLAQAEGVCILENCAVRGLDLAAGSVAGVETELGPIRAPTVLVAAGAWSRLFLRGAGVGIPQLSVLASVAATQPCAAPWAANVSDGVYAFRSRADGGLTLAPGFEHDFFIGPDAFFSFRPYLPTLRRDWRHTHFRLAAPKGFPDSWRTPRRRQGSAASPFEACRILNPMPNMASLSRAAQAFAQAFPKAPALRLRQSWAGMIDTLPDVVPILDQAAQVPGLFIATGLSGHGFGIGPGVGRVMADLIAGQAPGHDLTGFRLSRFADGSPHDPGSAL